MAMGGSITVHAWMWSDRGLALGVGSPKLFVYALVYQITAGEMGFMTSSSRVIAESLDMSASHVRHILNDLRQAGLIEQKGEIRSERGGRPIPCYVAVPAPAAKAIEACAGDALNVENYPEQCDSETQNPSELRKQGGFYNPL